MKNFLWKKEIWWSIIIVIITLSFSACKSESDASLEEGNAQKESESPSNDGSYYYLSYDNTVEAKINVVGNSWTGSFNVLGQQEFSSGPIKENNLYEESGYVKVGSISSGKIFFNTASGSITLRKN